jgi:hypothetical protein
MTFYEFSDAVRRIHRIDGDMVPELSPERQRAFVANPVQFFIRGDDDARKAIWDAMERDRRRWEGMK